MELTFETIQYTISRLSKYSNRVKNPWRETSKNSNLTRNEQKVAGEHCL